MIPHLLSVDDLREDFLINLWDEALKNKGKSNKNLENKIITNLNLLNNQDNNIVKNIIHTGNNTKEQDNILLSQEIGNIKLTNSYKEFSEIINYYNNYLPVTISYLNTEKITKLPSSKTELGDKVTTNKMADDNAIDISNYNMYNPGENDFSGAFTGFKSGLNTDDLKINVPDLGTMVSNALRNTTIGVSPSQNAENAKAKTNAEIDSEQEFIDNKGGMFKMKRGRMNRPGYSN